MKRRDFLDDKDVKGFVEWAGHLVRGEWGLRHHWTTQERYGGRFRCCRLYEAYLRYSWRHLSFDQTMVFFDKCRKELVSVDVIVTCDDKRVTVQG